MSPVLFFADYFLWHYSRAFHDIIIVFSNLMWFVGHFFSIPLLLRTLFSPWKRVTEEVHISGVEDFFGSILVNIITRIIGAVVRVMIIALGLLVLLALFVSMFVTLVLWSFAPAVVGFLFLYGFFLLFV